MSARRRFEILIRISADDVKAAVRQLRDAADVLSKMKDPEKVFVAQMGDAEGRFEMEGSRDDSWTRSRYLSERN